MFEYAAQCITRWQLMDKAEEQLDLTRIQILPILSSLYQAQISLPPAPFPPCLYTEWVKKIHVAVNESL